jgi:hypothetical protein
VAATYQTHPTYRTHATFRMLAASAAVWA